MPFSLLCTYSTIIAQYYKALCITFITLLYFLVLFILYLSFYKYLILGKFIYFTRILKLCLIYNEAFLPSTKQPTVLSLAEDSKERKNN